MLKQMRLMPRFPFTGHSGLLLTIKLIRLELGYGSICLQGASVDPPHEMIKPALQALSGP